MIKPRFESFKAFGCSQSNIVKNLSNEPWDYLEHSFKDTVVPSVPVLLGFLGSNGEVAKLFTNCTCFTRNDLVRTLLPNINLLSTYVRRRFIHEVIYYHNYSRVFLTNPEILKRLLEKVNKLRAERYPQKFLVCVRILTSMTDETWELKWQALRDLGFSEGDLLSMFTWKPQVLAVSVERIKKIIDVLLATGKYDMRCILCDPLALTASIEERYKPRIQVLQLLESKNLIKKWPSLSNLRLYDDDKFFLFNIKPHLNEVGEVLDGYHLEYERRQCQKQLRWTNYLDRVRQCSNQI